MYNIKSNVGIFDHLAIFPLASQRFPTISLLTSIHWQELNLNWLIVEFREQKGLRGEFLRPI